MNCTSKHIFASNCIPLYSSRKEIRNIMLTRDILVILTYSDYGWLVTSQFLLMGKRTTKQNRHTEYNEIIHESLNEYILYC